MSSFDQRVAPGGLVRSNSADRFSYHEMMSHVPLFAHGRVERVLVLGGGSGGLARQVFKHRSVRTLVQVQVDFPMQERAGSHVDGRFARRAGNPADFVASTGDDFDLILADSTDPGDTEASLLTEIFFRNARGCLRPGGVLIAPFGVPCLQPHTFAAAMKSLSTVFLLASPYLVPVPCVAGGPVAIGWGSNVLAPESSGIDVIAARHADARIETRYYTPEIHRASFALPQYIKDVVSAATRPDEAN